ncbi:MAG: S-layer protein [Candidatus Micrarchaeia archaeon]
MKGVNLKRIGAIVAGATLLASSVAFAGPLHFGDTQLVTESGQPLVKVVVGESAQASDGVAAAKIASYLAKEAYKTDTYTATVGDVTCTASGAGACTITDKSVTLDVTVPGATKTGSYTLNSLVGDYIDRTLLDRGTSSNNAYTLSNAETSTIANPNSDGAGSYLTSASSATYLYRIGSSQFTPMVDYTVKDEDATAEYKEVQNFWIGSESLGGYVKYQESADNLVLNAPILEYSLKFSGGSNDLGIPICTQATNTSLYGTCDDTYKTETHKVQVMFLGESWIISEMSAPSDDGTLTTEQRVAPGGYVKLAKESVNGVLNKGEYLTVGDLKFVLDDVSLGTGASNVHPAIVSVYAEGQTEPLTKTQINPSSTTDVAVTGYGTYKVHVYKTAPGYTFGATWADLAIFSDELKLEDNADLDPDLDNNNYWKVSLGWKNKGATSSETAPDHLRSIILWSDEVDSLLGDSDWTPGLAVPVVQSPVAWQLTFAGLDIDDSSRESLTFTMERESQKQVSINATAKCNITAPYAKVVGPTGYNFDASSAESPVTPGTTLAGYDKEFYIALNASGAGAIQCDSGAQYDQGSVVMKSGTSSSSYYVVQNNSEGTGYTDVKWDFAGASSSWTQGGVIRVFNNITFANTTLGLNTDWASVGKTTFLIGISEDAGEGESANMPERLIFGVNYSGASSTFNYDATDTTLLKKDYVYSIHAGPAYTANGTVEEGYISERGSKFVAIDDTSVKFRIANDVAHAQVTLASVEESDISTNAVRLSNLKEGEEAAVPGSDVKVKVVEIKATGTCATGAAGTPVCAVSGDATAYLKNAKGENVGATLSASTPYTGSVDLVVLDSGEAAGTLITVGGPLVNKVTAAAGADGTFELKAAGDVVVTQVGNKIVVAGYTAADTLTATEQFLASLKTN